METNNNYVVYCHICPNGKRYYGMTLLKPKMRWGKNGNGYKNNIEFYEAIQLYGWDNIEHLIVADNLTKEEAELLEEKLIRDNMTYDSNYGYNKFIGMKMLGKNNHRAQSVICTTTMTVFDTIRDGADYYGTYRQSISRCCRGELNNAGKLEDGTSLQWKYIDIIIL